MNTIKTALMKVQDVDEVNIDQETEIITMNGNTEKSILVTTLYPEKEKNILLKKARSYVSCSVGKMN